MIWWIGGLGTNQMTGDKEIDNTVWYDKIVNQLIQDHESSKLAASLQEGAETPSQTSSHAPSKGTS
ncbi:hypothetical protein [Synechococcus phage DSL-LC03]|nr:hypothetical protein [Synechococcus phage DSL-LC03]